MSGPQFFQVPEVGPEISLNAVNVLDGFDIFHPVLRDGDGKRAPIEDGSADLILRLLDHAAQGRLAYEKLLGGFGKTLFLIDRVDIIHFSQHKYSFYFIVIAYLPQGAECRGCFAA